MLGLARRPDNTHTSASQSSCCSPPLILLGRGASWGLHLGDAGPPRLCQSPGSPTRIPRLGLVLAANLQGASFPCRSLPRCWIEPMLWAAGGGWGLWGCLCVSATRFCICPKAVPPLRFVGSLSASFESCLGTCGVAGFGECRLHAWAQMTISRYQQQQTMFIWGKTWSQHLVMRERWRVRAKRQSEKPLTNSTVRRGSIRESPPGPPCVQEEWSWGTGGDRWEKLTLKEQEVKAFALEVRWPAGAASGAGQGSTRSAGWGSWAVSGGGLCVAPGTLNPAARPDSWGVIAGTPHCTAWSNVNRYQMWLQIIFILGKENVDQEIITYLFNISWIETHLLCFVHPSARVL